VSQIRIRKDWLKVLHSRKPLDFGMRHSPSLRKYPTNGHVHGDARGRQYPVPMATYPRSSNDPKPPAMVTIREVLECATINLLRPKERSALRVPNINRRESRD
jgi:hypothetical protein